ncbi:MAG: ABC transporter permease, partial [Bacilli bacterium]|nr:ABC transporter permease [Bacilli bacterium]
MKYGRILITMSKEYKHYLYKLKLNKILIIITRLFILLFSIILWQYLANKNIINTFITSSPKEVLNTIIKLYNSNNLFHHIKVTIYETLISFTLATILGILISIILWWNKFIDKVIDPYLTVLNSLPKVALGPIIIIWSGANTKSIIIMALLISLIITIITISNSFKSTDINKINLLKSFKASKYQILKYLILPSNYNTIISTLKINISMSLIGVITGEFLVSKEGIGYLIVYGSQVFNLSLVISGILILLIVSYLMYLFVSLIEKILIKN